MKKFFFARQYDDRLTMPLTPGYDTREEAAADATKLLRLKGAAKIVLLEVVESIEVVAKVKFTPFSKEARNADRT